MGLTQASKKDLQNELGAIVAQIQDINQAEDHSKEAKVADKIKSNPKAFYAYANKSRKIKTK